MSPKQRTNREDIQLVHNTLRLRDPEQLTITVGSVALVAQLHEVGTEAPIGCEDVDVLCPQEYFDELLRKGPYLDGIDKFQVRWPKGRLKERGATNKSIDIYPSQADVLSFTACYSMSDLWYPIDYDSCQADVVIASGVRCLKIGNMLQWLAIIGRHKDIDTVEKVLPLARRTGLVDDTQEEIVLQELEATYQQRLKHPEWHYARMDS